MNKHNIIFTLRLLAMIAIISPLGACGIFSRLGDIGKEPTVSPIANPVAQSGYEPVQMPMPKPQEKHREPNSLWMSGSRAFFKDLRASEIGDILTVTIEMSDSAELSNLSQRGRQTSSDNGISALLGFEGPLNAILPGDSGLNPSISYDNATATAGSGSISRNETIRLKVAAVVTQRLPNGNLVLIGRQEFRVNNEVRELQIAGVVRPQDVSRENTVSYEKVAEARVSYGGRGHITEMQMPRYGEQIADILLPF